MKNKVKQVLIIGAGGSRAYNFPLGEELFNNVQTSYIEYAKDYETIMHTNKDQTSEMFFDNARLFIDKLRGISGISLDKYINLNPQERENGIKSLFVEIIRNEQSSFYPGTDKVKEDWYKYLFNKMISGLDSFDDIQSNFHNNIGIITFNYDRSLENYLFNNLYRILKPNHTEKEIALIIESIPFIHVYGKTGYLEWETNKESSKVAPYGKCDWTLYALTERALDMIQLIYDERKNSTQIQNAQKLIRDADRILFCGFGYDKINLSILGFPFIFNNQKVFGTAFESTKNEIIHISKLLSQGENNRNLSIENTNCLTLLREHLLV